ncbi:MAG: TlpA family protein disulfide reductase [Bacteroidetes bacterium]|nr:TlpA family protein disulfide reductase [Bacteroidota bacterium]
MRYCIGFFIFLIFISTTLRAQINILVKGEIKGAKENAAVSLHLDNPANEVLVKGIIQKGKFELKGVIPEPAIYMLVVEGTQQSPAIFLDAAVVKVKAHFDSLNIATITGSILQKDFQSYRNQFDPYFFRIDQLGKQINAPAYANKRDSLLQIARSLAEELEAKADVFIKANNKSLITPLLIYSLYSFFQQPDPLDRRFDALDAAVKKSYYGRMMEKIISENKVGSIGSVAPDFTQTDTSGNPVSLQSFRGKYVLVDFWASWCGPCRMENPNLVQAFQKYKAKNFTVLGVSLDRAKEPWLQAIAQDQLQWTHLSDLKFWSNDVARMYKISSIPQNFLLDPEGKIIAKNLRGEELHAKLEEILSKNP